MDSEKLRVNPMDTFPVTMRFHPWQPMFVDVSVPCPLHVGMIVKTLGARDKFGLVGSLLPSRILTCFVISGRRSGISSLFRRDSSFVQSSHRDGTLGNSGSRQVWTSIHTSESKSSSRPHACVKHPFCFGISLIQNTFWYSLTSRMILVRSDASRIRYSTRRVTFDSSSNFSELLSKGRLEKNSKLTSQLPKGCPSWKGCP